MLKFASDRITFFSSMAIALLAMLACAPAVFADAAAPPSTRPADDTPQAFANSLTNERVAAMTVDEAMTFLAYDPASDKEKSVAKLTATNSIAASKIELAARDKWGKDGEATVAHALGDNMPDDLAAADWAVDGNHAVIQFKLDGLSPLVLIKSDGHWKVDLTGSRKLAGADVDQDLKVEQDASAMMDQLTKDLAKKDAYPSADAFADHVKEAVGKLGGSD